MNSSAKLNKSGFTAQVDVESSSRPASQLSSLGKPKRPLKIALGVGISVICLVALAVGGLVLHDRLFAGSTLAGKRGSGLLSSRSSFTSLKHSAYSSALAVSKAAVPVRPLPARIWESVKQRPKTAAIVTSIVAVIIIGAIVASVLLLRPSPQVDIAPTAQEIVPQGSPSTPNIGAIAGGVIAVVALVVVVVVVLVKCRPCARRGPSVNPPAKNKGGYNPTPVVPLVKNKGGSNPKPVDPAPETLPRTLSPLFPPPPVIPPPPLPGNLANKNAAGPSAVKLSVNPQKAVAQTLASKYITDGGTIDPDPGNPNRSDTSKDPPAKDAWISKYLLPPLEYAPLVMPSESQLMDKLQFPAAFVDYLEAERMDELVRSNKLKIQPLPEDLTDEEVLLGAKGKYKSKLLWWEYPSLRDWASSDAMQENILKNRAAFGAIGYCCDEYPEITFYTRRVGVSSEDKTVCSSMEDLLIKSHDQLVVDNYTQTITTTIEAGGHYTLVRLGELMVPTPEPRSLEFWRGLYKMMLWFFSRSDFKAKASF